MMPMENNGSMFVYHKLIKPFVKKHEKTFEAAMDIAEDAAKAGAKKGKMIVTINFLFLSCFVTMLVEASLDTSNVVP